MKNRLTMLLALAALVLSGGATPAVSAEPSDWRELLDKPLDDDWMQIFGVGGRQTVQRGRPAETVAEKFSAFQEFIAKSSSEGIIVPVFLAPGVAAKQCEPIPPTPPRGVHVRSWFTQVPVIEAFRYVAEKYHCVIIVTEHGILLKPKQRENP
jgi:hypothetical protein